METFADLREDFTRFTENKDRFIQKNTLLTDEQKAEVLDFFRSHVNLENRIQSWNYNIPYETFKQVMDSVDTADKRLKKQTRELRKQSGLNGLVEGEDYILVGRAGDIVVYRPLTHKASRVIASNMVEPKIWCKSAVMDWSPKEILPEGEPMKDGLYPGAKWCISMETDEHWESYTKKGRMFFMVCNPKAPGDEKKICATYDKDLQFINLTRADDASTQSVEYLPLEALNLINQYLKNLQNKKLEKLSGYLNKTSGRYDYLNKEFTPRDLIEDGKFIVPIGIWEGNFNCEKLSLISLENSPIEVKGFFLCNNNYLTSLEGSPRKVTGGFNCRNNKLTSLKGAPEKVGGNFDCNYNLLPSLEGSPKRVGGWFNCSNNNLTSLEGASEFVGTDFDCSYNKLTSLKGAPIKIKKNFYCSNNELFMLKGGPKEVGRNFDCSNNQLVSLKGSPEKVGKNFLCGRNPLTSLEGKPEYIGGEFLK